MPMQRLLLVVGLMGILFAAAACGDGEGGTSPKRTRVPQLTIVGTDVIAPAREYRAEFPEGWTAGAMTGVYGDVTLDAFFAPEEIGGVRPNISVALEQLPRELALFDYVDKKLVGIEGLGGEDVSVSGAVEVAGHEAAVVDYVRSQDPFPIDKRDVIFVAEDLGYTISLVAPGGQRDQFLPFLDDFLASFELLEDEES